MLDLLKKALFSVSNNDLLREVRKHAAEIRRALEENETSFSDDELRRMEEYPAWTAAVFDALSGDEKESGGETAVMKAIRSVLEDEEQRIADTFSAAVENLPGEFSRWHVVFAGLPQAPEEYQQHLRKSRVVKLTGEAALGLIRFGLSPVSFFEAARGVRLLSDGILGDALAGESSPTREDEDLRERREMRRMKSSVPDSLTRLHDEIRERVDAGELPALGISSMTSEDWDDQWPMVPPELTLSAVRGAVYGPPEAALPLLNWLVRASHSRRFLFVGYEVETIAASAVLLKRDAAGDELDDMHRWASEMQAHPARVLERVR